MEYIDKKFGHLVEANGYKIIENKMMKNLLKHLKKVINGMG